MATYRHHAAASAALILLFIATIVAGCNTNAPNVVDTQPKNGATNVPISPAAISLTFNQDMVQESATKAVTVTPTVGAGVPEISWNGSRTMVVSFPQNFQPNTAYTVKVSKDAMTTGGYPLDKTVTFSFTTGSAAAGAGAGAQGTTTCVPEQPTQPGQPAQAEQPSQPTQPAQPTMTFTKDIKPLAEAKCDRCHSSMATGKMSVYANASKFVKPNDPEGSPFYTRPSGNNHPNILGDQANVVKNWINSGAKE